MTNASVRDFVCICGSRLQAYSGCSQPQIGLGKVPSYPSVPHLSRAHIAAEGISMAATSSVQSTFIDGHTDAAIPAPAFVANAVVGT